jgi:hypothetical protein
MVLGLIRSLARLVIAADGADQVRPEPERADRGPVYVVRLGLRTPQRG